VLDFTPLSIAVMRASFEIIKILFNRGGSIHHGQLLHYAIYRKKGDYLEVLDFLLDHGPSINDIMYQNRVEIYLMRMAFGLGTPLHKAAELGKLDIVKHLIKKGADPLIPDARRQIALELAQSNGHHQVVDYLRPFSSTSSMARHSFTDAPGFHV
jgi:ankyrin repeat protein